MSVRTIAAIICTAAAVGAAESWAAHAGSGGRREISGSEARSAGTTQVQDRRNKLRIRRIRPAMGGVDWDTDPTAIPYYLYQVNQRTGMPVHVDNDGLDLASPALFEETIVYLTSHGRWGLNEQEGENLARFLRRGGTLYLDDCYNRGSPFTECVRPEVQKLFPGAEPAIVLKEDANVADAFRLGYQPVWPGDSLIAKHWQYYQIEGRPAVWFSPNDDGCAWEISTPPSASNPLGEGIGHGGDNAFREIVYQWCTSWMLFAMTH